MSNARARARRRFARIEEELAQREEERAEYVSKLKKLLAKVPQLKSADECIRMNEEFLNLFETIATSTIALGPFERLFKPGGHQSKDSEEEFEEVKAIMAQKIDEAMDRKGRQNKRPKHDMGK